MVAVIYSISENTVCCNQSRGRSWDMLLEVVKKIITHLF